MTDEQKKRMYENTKKRRITLTPETKEKYKQKALDTYAKNRDARLIKKKEYREKNAEKIKAYMDNWHKENKDHTLDYGRKRYSSNPEKARKYRKDWYLKNKDFALDQAKIYRKNNKVKIRQYYNDRHKTNSLFAMSNRARNRINDFIRKKGYSKTSKTSQLLGCSWITLHDHIEKQFTNGMKWSNRELWHIDHIVPLASAKNEDELVRLCHFSNLRPLWAKENHTKSDKIITCQPELCLNFL